MEKQRVIVINYMGRHGSGNINAYMMAKTLIEEGQKVVAVVSKYADNINSWRKLDLTELIEVETYQNVLQFAYRSVMFYLYGAKKVAHHLEEKYEIQAVYNAMLTYWTFGLNRCLKNCKRITCNHDPIPHSGDRKRWSFQKELDESDVIIVHSRKFLEFVKNQYKDKQVVYLPLQRLSAYDLPNKKKAIKYDAYKINFLFFGTFSKYKGLEILAQAYSKVKEEVDDVTLTVAGSGDFSPYKEAYDNLCDKDVTIINRWIEDEEVESFFVGENIVVVVPYTDATQSGPIQLAFEYNDTVIASNTGGIPEQIEDGKTGVLVEPSNVIELSKAMIKVAKDRSLRDNLKKNMKIEISNRTDSEIARQLIDVIYKSDY